MSGSAPKVNLSPEDMAAMRAAMEEIGRKFREAAARVRPAYAAMCKALANADANLKAAAPKQTGRLR